MEPGPSGRRAAAGVGALAARRDMATQHDDWTPPVYGAPAVAGAPSRTLSARGASPSCIVRSTAGWATALERWRGRQGARVRLHDRRAERVVQHARASHVRQLATNVGRPAGEQASTVTSARDADGDNRTFAVTFNYQGTVAETETFTDSRERTSPTCGISTDESTQEKGLRAKGPIWYGV